MSNYFVSYVYSFNDDSECERYYGSEIISVDNLETTADIRRVEDEIESAINSTLSNRRVVWLTLQNITLLRVENPRGIGIRF